MRTTQKATIVGLLIIASNAFSEVKLAGMFGDNMVIQRDRPTKVWGWADPGETVTVSIAGQTQRATTTEGGSWIISLAPMPANKHEQALTVASGAAADPITLKGILIGDVWLCSGQSNMEWTLNRSSNHKEATATDHPLIRHIKIAHNASSTPVEDVQSEWIPATNGRAANFSAVGFYFARDIQSAHDVPIGLIGSNWGGTKIEPWTTPEGFQMVPELDTINEAIMLRDPGTQIWKQKQNEYLDAMDAWTAAARKAVDQGTALPALPQSAIPAWRSHQDPTRLYNGMIHPLRHVAIKGAIWYQGESNGSEGETYYQKKHALVKGWRKLWGYDFPFYFVQLANFQASTDAPGAGNGWARLREAQLKALDIPHTGMACIIDIGEARNIHPGNKFDVGARLARWARFHDYGETERAQCGPLYKGSDVTGNAITIHFDHVYGGLMVGSKKDMAPTTEVTDGTLKRFAIAGADKVWHWADARIDGESVVVTCADVPEPVAVRYAFSMNPAGCNLYNREGLPASPFRTDDW